MRYEVWKTNELGYDHFVKSFNDLHEALEYIKACEQNDLSSRYRLI